jgi:hypothetical protein
VLILSLYTTSILFGISKRLVRVINNYNTRWRLLNELKASILTWEGFLWLREGMTFYFLLPLTLFISTKSYQQNHHYYLSYFSQLTISSSLLLIFYLFFKSKALYTVFLVDHHLTSYQFSHLQLHLQNQILSHQKGYNLDLLPLHHSHYHYTY